MAGASQWALVVKNTPTSAGDIRGVGSIPGLGRSPGEGNGNPLQYSCLRNPMDRGAWWVTVHELERVGHNLATKQTTTNSSLSGCKVKSHCDFDGHFPND